MRELTQQIALENQRARADHALGIVDQGFDACAVRTAERWTRPSEGYSAGQ